MATITTAHELPGSTTFLTHHQRQPILANPPSDFPQQHVNDLGSASETGSVHTRSSRRRAGSFSRFFKWHSPETQTQQSQTPPNYQYYNNNYVPPIPSLPPTSISKAQQQEKQAQAAQENGRKRSFSGSRKISLEGRNMFRKASRTAKAKADEDKLEQERRNQPVPSLPVHNSLPSIDTFGDDNTYTTSNSPSRVTNFSRPGGVAMPPSNINNSSSPAYAIRPSQTSSPPESRSRANGEYVTESISRTESMTNRGRSSYASSTVGGNMSSPRRIRRRKDPTPFNVLVIGAKNSGKTSFISFLRHSLALPATSHSSTDSESTIGGTRSSFTSHYLETEMDGERVGLTIWDSAGLEKSLVDLQLREMTVFVESKFEDTFAEEQKVVRSPGVKDTHIHCVFLILDPIRLDATVAASTTQQKNGVSLSNVSGLDDELDLQVMRALWGKTTVIPVIAKADTLTQGHMSFLKRTVWDSIKSARLDPLEALELEDDTIDEGEEDEDGRSSNYDDHDKGESQDGAVKSKTAHKRQSSLSTSIKSIDEETPYIPMSIISPDPYDLPPYAKTKPSKTEKVGRRFPWGFANPYSAEHCDFTRLRDSIFVEWRGELRDLSRSKWYENWRTSRLNNVPGTKQRLKGGVTPVAAVPQGGLTARNFSGQSNGASSVPRSVSTGSAQPNANQAVGGVDSRSGVRTNA